MEICKNKKAYHDYVISEKYEAGIILSSSEVKSCLNHNINIQDSYISIDKNKIFLYNSFIATYKNSSIYNHKEYVVRELLMHKKEILKLSQKIKEQGYTLIPLSVYTNNHNKIKIEFGLAKGKHNYDKRESLKKKELNNELRRINRTC